MKKTLLLLLFILLAQIMFAKETHMKNALVVYASFMGSTKEVAAKIKETLEDKGCKVDVMAAENKAVDLSKYGLVVIGSAIHGAQPHPDVVEFVNMNREALNKKPTAVFIVCITITSSKQDLREKAGHYPELIAVGFKPVSTAVFGGKANDGGWFGNMMGEWIMGIKTGDFRDWEKIETWAGEIAGEF